MVEKQNDAEPRDPCKDSKDFDLIDIAQIIQFCAAAFDGAADAAADSKILLDYAEYRGVSKLLNFLGSEIINQATGA